MITNFLLADDDPDDVDLFGSALKDIHESIAFHYALNGKDLIEKLQGDHGTPPQVIFLDVNMPEMNGWDCLANLKNDEKLKDIPVVMYSTSSAKRDARNAIELGAVCFYEKPSNYNQLKDFLKFLVYIEYLDRSVIEEHVRSGYFKNQKIFI
jgi:CheY-like chemotaxis protein